MITLTHRVVSAILQPLVLHTKAPVSALFALIMVVWLLPLGCVVAQEYTTQYPAVGLNTEWVVVLKDPRPVRLQGFQVRGYSAHYTQSLALKRFGKRVAKQYKLTLKQEWFIDSLGVYCLIVNVTENTADTLNALRNDDRVNWVQASNSFELLNTMTADHLGVVRSSLNSPESKTSSTPLLDGRGVRIALIDSGVSRGHPDLGTSITLNQDVVVGGVSPQTDGESHGTAMAGIIVAEPTNPLGLRGVAPAAKVLAYRGCWETAATTTRCNTLSLARALDAVLKAQPSILNLSLTGPRDQLLERLIDKVVAQGVLVVTAFDPQRSQANRFPVRRNGVLIVRAEHMDQDQHREFTAPGTRIVIAPNAQYTTMSGHSVATAYTSGLLALVVQSAAKQGGINWNTLVDDYGYAHIGSAQRMIQLKRL